MLAPNYHGYMWHSAYASQLAHEEFQRANREAEERQAWNSMSMNERADYERNYARLDDESRSKGIFITAHGLSAALIFRGPFTEYEDSREGLNRWADWKSRSDGTEILLDRGLILGLSLDHGGFKVAFAALSEQLPILSKSLYKHVVNNGERRSTFEDLEKKVAALIGSDDMALVDRQSQPQSFWSMFRNFLFTSTPQVDALALCPLVEAPPNGSALLTQILQAYGCHSGHAILIPQRCHVVRDTHYHTWIETKDAFPGL